jgi:cyclic pyranopterin phosphate synthase
MNCYYCHNEGQNSDVRNSPDSIDLTRFRAAATMISNAGINTANITGGEFLVRPDWRSLFKIIHLIFPKIIVTTNGSLLNRSNIAYLCSSGVSRFNVSLDTVDTTIFKSVTSYPDVNKIISCIEWISEYKGVDLVVNTLLLKNVNDSIEAMAAIGKKVYPFAKRINVIKPHNNQHRPEFKAAGLEYYMAFLDKMKKYADHIEEKSFDHGSHNSIVWLGGTEFHFKRTVPRYDIPFCASCTATTHCTEWIIPPRFHAENGIFSACMLNHEKSINMYVELSNTNHNPTIIAKRLRKLVDSASASLTAAVL